MEVARYGRVREDELRPAVRRDIKGVEGVDHRARGDESAPKEIQRIPVRGERGAHQRRRYVPRRAPRRRR